MLLAKKKTWFFIILAMSLMVLATRSFATEEHAPAFAEEQSEGHEATPEGHGENAHAEPAHGEHHVASLREVAVPMAFRFTNFFIFIGALVFLLRKPLAKFLAERRQSISDIIDQSAERRDWAEKKYQEYNSRLDNIGQEIEALNTSLRREGEREREDMLREAEKLAQSIKKDALLVADAELVDLKRELRDEAIETASLVAKETLLRLKDENDEKRLADDLINQLGRQSA